MGSTATDDTPIESQIPSYLLQCPPEILHEIFDSNDVDKKALVARGPLCSAILPFYHTQLYRSIILKKNSQWPLLYSAISKNPNLGKLIKSFSSYGAALKLENNSVFIPMLALMTEVLQLELVTHTSFILPSFVDGIWLKTVASSCRKLEKLRLSLFLTPVKGHSFTQQLKPLNSLPNLKTIHLVLLLPDRGEHNGVTPDLAPAVSEVKLPIRFWHKIKHLRIITEAFSEQELPNIAEKLYGLTKLEIHCVSNDSHRVPPIDLNQLHKFLSTIPSARLQVLTMKGDSPEDKIYSPPFLSIDDFLAKCTKLRKLNVGFPVLADINALIRLDYLHLSRGAGFTSQSIESLIQAYTPNSRKKPLKLLLSDVDVGLSAGETMAEGLYDYLDEVLDPEFIEEQMAEFGWQRSIWNSDIYDREAAQRLIRLGEAKNIVMGGDIVEAIKVDEEFEEELMDNLNYMEEMGLGSEGEDSEGDYSDELEELMARLSNR